MDKKTLPQPSVSPQENPTVLIRYQPYDALAILGEGVLKAIAKLDGVKITTIKQLESASEILDEAQVRAEMVRTFLASLRERVQEAGSRFAEVKGFTHFRVNLSVIGWDEWNQLQDGIAKLKTSRAQFLDAERVRVQREQLEREVQQSKINRKAAEEAAKTAKAQGADKYTVADIKQAVLETPAPLVANKAAEVAQAAGASVRYDYSAELYDLKKFLGLALNNETIFNTLKAAIPDIEKAYRSMARAQRESFAYAGIRFRKTPVDVSRKADA